MHQSPIPFTIRLATLDKLPVLQGLIADSVWVLQAGDYTDEQREAAIRLVYGIDTQLIRDGTYFAVEHDGQIVACGGWSRRRSPLRKRRPRRRRLRSKKPPLRKQRPGNLLRKRQLRKRNGKGQERCEE